MRTVTISALVALFLAVDSPSAQSPCPQALNLATELGRRFDFGRAFPPRETTFEIEERDPLRTIRYMRVRMRVNAPPTSSWQLVVRDVSGHAIEVLTASHFARSQERWTTRVPGPLVRFDRFVEQGAPESVDVHFLEYVAMDTDAKSPYYSYQEPANPKIFPLYDSQSPATLDDRRLGDSTAFLMGAAEGKVWTCSGVAIAPNLLMTNWHCGGIAPMLDHEYWTDSICRTTLIDVSWDDDGRSQEFMCVGRPIVDRSRDVAILQIEPLEGVSAIRPATLSRAGPTAGMVKLVHHPEGKQKRIGLNCDVKAVAHPGWPDSSQLFDFTHTCDSEGGSSGAPIFNHDGLVVGLHHHGFQRDPKTCEAQDRVNKAIRMDEILKWLETSSEFKALNVPLRVR